MRLCPACGNQYPDDANFCPMDATRLPPPAAAPAPVVAEVPAASTLQNQPRPIAGRFLITGPQEQTPTGAVAEAQDAQSGGAPVMLKLVAPETLPSATMADRALRELKQLGKVASERIVRVIDQGRTEDGRIYVATETVAGSTLEELIAREGALPVERATSIVLQIGEALTEAQKVGVIHRDVAPRNVWVGPDGRVKVGEFGLAERVTDKVFGAPAYLSPEQVEGKPVDQRSNIYSLGAIFYAALTGRPPFEGAAQSQLEQQVSATPSAPSTKRPGGLSPEIDRIVLKALEKSGGRRHLTLRQLLGEIEAASNKAGLRDEAAMARTQMATTPSMPAAQPRAMAATVMGLPSMAPLAAPTTPSMGAVTTPSMPLAAPDARTLVPDAQPMPSPPVMAPAHAPSAPQAPTMAEARPAPAMPSPPAAAPIATAVEKRPLQPPPAVQAAMATAAANRVAAATEKKAAGGGFRETAWFKKGEIEEEMAKAQAAHATEDPLATTGTTGKQAAVDTENVDVSAQDRARLSLKTGATQAMPVIKAAPPAVAVPGDRMSEDEMLAEIDSSKKWFIIAGVIVGVAILAVVLYFVLGRGSSGAEAPTPPKPEAVAASPPAPPPPTPPAAVPPPAAPTPAPPAAAPPAPSADKLLAEAAAAAKKDDLAGAVDALGKAADAGANPAAVKKLEAQLGKSIAARMKLAKKHKDKAAMNELKSASAKLGALRAKKR
ncbi:MAG TPA: protein kinase [Polyangia bacterium]|nr:protein kinase [Polyangia bacterium]